VAIDPSNGSVFGSESLNNRIQKFTHTGDFILSWGNYCLSDGHLMQPYGVAVDKNGSVFVSDDSPRIQKFTNEGSFITSWGTIGSGVGQFGCGSLIALDSTGNVFATDTCNNRIQEFTNDGVLTATRIRTSAAAVAPIQERRTGLLATPSRADSTSAIV